jgi:hypothetical protein
MGDQAAVKAVLRQVQLRRARRSHTYSGQSGPKARSDSTSNQSSGYHSMLARVLNLRPIPYQGSSAMAATCCDPGQQADQYVREWP